MRMHTSARRLYVAAQVRELDRRAVMQFGISGYELMQRAAAGCWSALRQRWPNAQRIVVVAGPGKNGGDGYEIARLARADGCQVEVLSVGARPQSGDAATACAAWGAEGLVGVWSGRLPTADVLVDALFGVGLSRPPVGDAAAAIAAINAARGKGAGVLAVDLPSGLDASSGAARGAVVRADLTVTFIGDKLGLHTAEGPDCAGTVVLEPLELPASVYAELPATALLMHAGDLRRLLPPRARGTHKNRNGHVCVIGGNHGMAGAVLLAARAALRAGAGLVTVATRAGHAVALTAAQPELMCHGVEDASALAPLLQRADVIAIGPGLGQDAWAQALWGAARASGKPLIVDADALNLLAQAPQRLPQAVLTPHPGEAARLLGRDSRTVQLDRLDALRALQERYDAVVVLKGAGTMVVTDTVWLCPYGNPGMAVAGMGDALTGVMAGLRAQGLSNADAAHAGVLAHALAGDRAAARCERGLLPSDLILALRETVNPV